MSTATITNTLERLEKSARFAIGVPCVALVGNDRIEVISILRAGFITLTYKRNYQVVNRNDILLLSA
ncbi:hypothetical protein [Beggiatoa leptomitoformis]|uniref:Uncharacterized protein n=1 Tax=Beggiatoa leptomitoformis TaxID=288004 RepID=A0A2N9YHH8_9GAMM|nr:hypothetical protein [Beggiatoa leptomitoformis]ALG67767.1 hypothetical protein AL038_08675 [Beggiatoa leptomitoformis]AUI69988.1 hypothetical protein BLE401_15635 [Beggiatoa leptomitoformis]